MTNVEIVDSLKYGLKLFGYFLGIVILGGGGMILGGVLAGPELQNWSSSGNFATAELLGGLVIAILGITIWFTGLFGIAYKLLTDSVTEGVSRGADSISIDVPDELSRESTESRGTGPTGPSPGEQTARQHGPGTTVPSAASVTNREHATERVETAAESESPPAADSATSTTGTSAEESTTDETRTREASTESEQESGAASERSAEEIAFGTEAGHDDSDGSGIPPYEEISEEDTTDRRGDTDAPPTEDDRSEPPSGDRDDPSASDRDEPFEAEPGGTGADWIGDEFQDDEMEWMEKKEGPDASLGGDETSDGGTGRSDDREEPDDVEEPAGWEEDSGDETPQSDDSTETADSSSSDPLSGPFEDES